MSRRKLPSRRRRFSASQRKTDRQKISRGTNSLGKYFGLLISFFIKLTAVVFIAGVLLAGSMLVFDKNIWDGKERMVMALQIERQDPLRKEVFLASFLPGENSLMLVGFPEGMNMDTVGGYGSWRVESIYPLGELEGQGGDLLTRSIANYLGIEVEGWIYSQENWDLRNGDSIDELAELMKSCLIKKGKTNLGSSDLIRLYQGISSMSLGRLRFIDLENLEILEKQTQPDGSFKFIGNRELMDRFVREEFNEPQIVMEGLDIVVLNSTEYTALGQVSARTIQNIGGDVLAVRDYEDSQESNKIIIATQELEESFTVKKLENIFSVDELKIGDTSEYRSDVVLIVGEEYYRSLKEL